MQRRYLRLHTCADGINRPSSSVVVIEMNFGKTHPRMALPSPIKEAMMDSYSDTTILVVLGVSPNQHCLVVIEKMAPATQPNLVVSSNSASHNLIQIRTLFWK